ncbi:hypothetical protein ACTNES_03145 [Blautia sp. HCP3S3_D9]|uniref:hypothetical protein n=1 Tax=unclassified Blautia TaxID=2648079 RepID=UPI002ED4D0D6
MKKNRTKIQMVLTALVILSVVRQFFLGNYHNMFLGILTLILFMVPQFLDRKLSVTIPPGLETVILIFIFSAEILGEINAFYVKIPIWDTILHTMKDLIVNFIGAVVFSIIGILYLRTRGKGKLAASLIPQVRSKQEEEHSSRDQ